jgi:hypothetical protein
VCPLSFEADSWQELRVRDQNVRVGLADSRACGCEIEVVLPSMQHQRIELPGAESAPPICGWPFRGRELISVVPRVRLREGRSLIALSRAACTEHDAPHRLGEYVQRAC